MFKSETVLVVGAGASCEAGLPSGEALKGKLAQLLDIRFDEWGSTQMSGDGSICEALRDATRGEDGIGGSLHSLLQKAWRIRDVVPTAAISIDNFLDAHRGDTGLELCGKLAIVKSILDAELASKLKFQGNTAEPRFNLGGLAGTWYVRFLQMLTEGVRRDEAKQVGNNISIITFNYDRCIEHFLVQGLADYFDLTSAEAQAIVASIPIYHPYGSVGPLPWQDRERGIRFGSESANLLSIAKQIKTFTEGMDDEDMLASMHSALVNAETLVFLGFAFHPTNMQLLRPPQETDVKRIFATTLGLSDADEAVIQDDILRMLRKNYSSYLEQEALRPQMAKLECGKFFHHYFRSLSAAVD